LKTVNFKSYPGQFYFATKPGPQLACLHNQSKSGLFRGRLFSSPSGLFENFSDFCDWLDKSRPSKKATFVL